jgi:hypothetical protein
MDKRIRISRGKPLIKATGALYISMHKKRYYFFVIYITASRSKIAIALPRTYKEVNGYGL